MFELSNCVVEGWPRNWISSVFLSLGYFGPVFQGSTRIFIRAILSMHALWNATYSGRPAVLNLWSADSLVVRSHLPGGPRAKPVIYVYFHQSWQCQMTIGHDLFIRIFFASADVHESSKWYVVYKATVRSWPCFNRFLAQTGSWSSKYTIR